MKNLVLILIVFTVFSCKTPQKNQAVAAPAKQQVTVLAEMTRYACFGTCPEYTVTFYTSGKALYEGKRNVAKVGKYEKQFEKAEVEKLSKAFDDIKFFDLKDEYPANITDVPATYITYVKDGKKKQIKDLWEGPKELKNLQKLVDDYSNTEGWKEIK